MDKGSVVGSIGRFWRRGEWEASVEGTGATVVAAVGMLTERMDIEAVALAPRQYAKIKDFPLPLPELRGDEPPPHKSLRVVVAEDGGDWWAEELREYAGVGLDVSKSVRNSDP